MGPTLALALALALVLAAAPAAAGERHRPLDPGDAAEGCESCHANATPQVVEAWSSGKHGLLLVKCFVCHGSTREDFARRVPARRCEGCHPAQVASLARAKEGLRAGPPGCFSCHSAHSLAAPEGRPNPHVTR